VPALPAWTATSLERGGGSGEGRRCTWYSFSQRNRLGGGAEAKGSTPARHRAAPTAVANSSKPMRACARVPLVGPCTLVIICILRNTRAVRPSIDGTGCHGQPAGLRSGSRGLDQVCAPVAQNRARAREAPAQRTGRRRTHMQAMSASVTRVSEGSVLAIILRSPASMYPLPFVSSSAKSCASCSCGDLLAAYRSTCRVLTRQPSPHSIAHTEWLTRQPYTIAQTRAVRWSEAHASSHQRREVVL